MANKGADDQQKFKGLLARALDAPLPLLDPIEFVDMFRISATEDQIASFQTYRDVLVHQLVRKGCQGENSSIKEIFDRLVGRPKQTAEVVTRDATYTDFLLSLVEADQMANPGGVKESVPEIIDVEPQQPDTDLLEDLM